MSGPGVGKSVLLGMLARMPDRRHRGGLVASAAAKCASSWSATWARVQRSVVRGATGRRATLGCACAPHGRHPRWRYFATTGKRVLLLLRFPSPGAMAQRELGWLLASLHRARLSAVGVRPCCHAWWMRAGTSRSCGQHHRMYRRRGVVMILTDPVVDAARACWMATIVLRANWRNGATSGVDLRRQRKPGHERYRVSRPSRSGAGSARGLPRIGRQRISSRWARTSLHQSAVDRALAASMKSTACFARARRSVSRWSRPWRAQARVDGACRGSAKQGVP